MYIGKNILITPDQSHGLILNPLCTVSQAVNFSPTTRTCSVHTTGQATCVELERRLQSSTRHFSLQEVHQKPSCLIPCSYASSISVFALCVESDSGNRNNQWSSILCQYCLTYNRTIFLPVESTDAFSVFIAWLNLDLGVETCFPA